MYKLKDFTTFVNESWSKVSPLRGELLERYGNVIEKIQISETSDNYLEIGMIIIKNRFRDNGYGTEIMGKIVEYCDRYGKKAHLTPTDEFGSNKSRLRKFYIEFGFVPNKGSNKDFRVKDTMIRIPRSLSESYLITELEFTDKEAFMLYSKEHDIRDTTSVTIGGKKTTAGKAKEEEAKRLDPSARVKGKSLSPSGTLSEKHKMKIEKIEDGVKIDGIEYKKQPEISDEKLLEIYKGDKKKVEKARKALTKHNMLMEKVESVLADGGELETLSAFPDTPPTSPENRDKLKKGTADNLSKAIADQLGEENITDKQREILNALGDIKNSKDENDFDERLMDITTKIFEDPKLSSASPDMVETISYMRELNKGNAAYLPSSPNFPLGDVISVSSSRLDPEKDSPEEMANKLKAITLGIENRSIKKDAGGASASHGKVGLTTYKDYKDKKGNVLVKGEDIKKDLNSLTSKDGLYRKIFSDEYADTSVKVKELAQKYGVAINSRSFNEKKKRAIETAVDKIKKANPKLAKPEMRKKLDAYYNMGAVFEIVYNNQMDTQLFTNEVWSYNDKTKKVDVDKTDGINRISKVKFEFNIGWTGKGKPSKVVPTRFKNSEAK
jgi:hypothetical protein